MEMSVSYKNTQKRLILTSFSGILHEITLFPFPLLVNSFIFISYKEYFGKSSNLSQISG